MELWKGTGKGKQNKPLTPLKKKQMLLNDNTVNYSENKET